MKYETTFILFQLPEEAEIIKKRFSFLDCPKNKELTMVGR